MSDSQVTSRLEMHWVSVADDRGRTQMEMRWVDPAAQSTPATSHLTPHVTHAA